jgi:uncharacterized protein YcnI
MNEEELKKGCGKEAGFITFTDDFGNKDEDVMLCGDTTKKINGEIELFLCDTCQARLEYFQKGKLEQKKEDKNKQDEFYNEFDLASNCSKDDKLFKKLWNKYFKQLQKEIGDDSQQTNPKKEESNSLPFDTKEIGEEKQDE